MPDISLASHIYKNYDLEGSKVVDRVSSMFTSNYPDSFFN
jgi:hypothetical protein